MQACIIICSSTILGSWSVRVSSIIIITVLRLVLRAIPVEWTRNKIEIKKQWDMNYKYSNQHTSLDHHVPQSNAVICWSTCVSVTSELLYLINGKLNNSAADFLASGSLHIKGRRERGMMTSSVQLCLRPSKPKTLSNSGPARQRVLLLLRCDHHRQPSGFGD